MGFHVEPQRVGPRRSPMPGVGVVIAGLAVVAIALITAGGPAAEPRAQARNGASPSPRPAAAATIRPASPSSGLPIGGLGTQPLAAASARPSPAPSSVDCHDTSPERCSQIALAAIRGLPTDGPSVETVSVWDSILCGSDEDCPASRFKGYQPLGSAIVSFGPGRPRAWLNVVEPTPYPGWVWVPADSRAWIIRWQG